MNENARVVVPADSSLLLIPHMHMDEMIHVLVLFANVLVLSLFAVKYMKLLIIKQRLRVYVVDALCFLFLEVR